MIIIDEGNDSNKTRRLCETDEPYMHIPNPAHVLHAEFAIVYCVPWETVV